MGGGDGLGVWIGAGDDEREGKGEGDCCTGFWRDREVEDREGDAGVVLVSFVKCEDGFRI